MSKFEKAKEDLHQQPLVSLFVKFLLIMKKNPFFFSVGQCHRRAVLASLLTTAAKKATGHDKAKVYPWGGATEDSSAVAQDQATEARIGGGDSGCRTPAACRPAGLQQLIVFCKYSRTNDKITRKSFTKTIK